MSKKDRKKRKDDEAKSDSLPEAATKEEMSGKDYGVGQARRREDLHLVRGA